MSGIKDQDRIEALRKRLYQRGEVTAPHKTHVLKDTPEKVQTKWTQSPQPKKTEPSSIEPVFDTPHEEQNIVDMPRKKRKKYRLKLVVAGLLFFVISVVISSSVLIFGNNNISAENITLAVTGPFTIGGGEVLPVQVGITNSNAVDIESATLIVEYPRGTQSTGDAPLELRTERLALDKVASGETINVPLRAVIFGEENDEKSIKVSIEYRVQGSNATFFKEADPLRFKISSSPVNMSVTALRKVSSGQETEVTISITSNAPTTLSEVLVLAEYPLGFDFTSSEPAPNSAQNAWLIANLEPEETRTIIIKGIVVGKKSDQYAINFSVGVPSPRDKQTLTSIFATAQTEFEIEQPFLAVNLEMAGKTNDTVVLEPGQRTGATIEIQNTLDDTIYDLVVEVQLGGNALSDLEVGPPNGFYDSLNNKIIWDISNAPELAELFPGKKTRLSFGIEPSSNVSQTPQITFDVNVKARRVSESQVTETLLGTAQSVIKVASAPTVRSDVGYNNGVFNDSGPIPPVAEKETKYTISLMVENGTNNISEVVTTATLPSYVQWLDQTSGSGNISFDEAKRLVTWRLNSVDANAAAFASFQVSLVPSKSQINTTPTLLGQQRLRANDKFTGTVVRAVNPAITTEMSEETGQPRDNGRVVE